MFSGNHVAPGTDVSIFASVKWGCETLLSLPRKHTVEPKLGLPNLGLQEVHELGKNYM